MKRLALVDGALHLGLPDEAPWILAEWVSGPDILVRLERTRFRGRCLNAASSANH
jgi:hypothetical protein